MIVTTDLGGADPDDSATMDYPTFEKQAIHNSVLLLKELVSRIA